MFAAQIASGRALLARENVSVERIDTLHRADMQFQGQSHILPVAIASPAVTVGELRATFAAAYWRRFGVELPEIRPVLVNLHTAVIGRRKPVSLRAIAAAKPSATLAQAQRTSRPVWFDRRLGRYADLCSRTAADRCEASTGRRSSSSSIARR